MDAALCRLLNRPPYKSFGKEPLKAMIRSIIALLLTKLRYGISLALAIVMFPCLSFASDFVIGITPHTSARVILRMYEPLRLYLTQSLGMPVVIVTAPNFTEFARRALNQEYDLAITTGHQARMLETDAQYLPLLTYKADFKAVAIVAVGGSIHKPNDLRGTNVLGLGAASLVTLWGQHWLAQNGLADVHVNYVSASDSVAQLLIDGEAAAGFTSQANFDALAPDIQGQLRILAESKPMAGRVYLLNNRHSHKRKAINSALWGFAETAEGKRYFKESKLDGYRKLKPGELKSMEPYAAEVRKILQTESR